MLTNESLEKFLGAFQEKKIVKRSEEKLAEQNRKIIELQFETQDNALQKLQIKWDGNGQYSPCLCIRIHGVQYN